MEIMQVTSPACLPAGRLHDYAQTLQRKLQGFVFYDLHETCFRKGNETQDRIAAAMWGLYLQDRNQWRSCK
jgi:hypothetical protein